MGDNDHRRPGRCKADAAASSVEDLRATPIPLPNGGWVRLEDWRATFLAAMALSLPISSTYLVMDMVV
ncbi:hypothetical protein [Paracoccus sp. PAR01]|uniref:hypothetical protein n=1 Tax=Paracoccus sp. PAR01 TaxID=2769282 RepID=UPI001780B01F|nr:hypothetical protein [Paracoccus sp. PAR01]MBD9529640.1 hypothetical protein [Paracoccus sp. PAR01]